MTKLCQFSHRYLNKLQFHRQYVRYERQLYISWQQILPSFFSLFLHASDLRQKDDRHVVSWLATLKQHFKHTLTQFSPLYHHKCDRKKRNQYKTESARSLSNRSYFFYTTFTSSSHKYCKQGQLLSLLNKTEYLQQITVHGVLFHKVMAHFTQ